MKKIIVLLIGLIIWFLAGKPIVWHDPQIPPPIPAILAVGESFTTNTDWVIPAGVTSITVEAWGGGGGGAGGAEVNKECGGGGAGSQYAKKTMAVSVGTTYSVTIGIGGTSNGSGAGAAGHDTIFGSSDVVAKGGAGGQPPTTYTGGVGTTTAGVGDTIYAGGSGADGTAVTTGGGGGGGAGTTGAGGNASSTTAGTGTSLYGGDGGDGATLNNATGTDASTTNYGGGGGGGCKSGFGGSGRQGYLLITYNVPPVFSIGASDVPDPVTIGSTVTFTGTASDDDDNWYLAICKTNLINAGSPPTCDTSQTFCVSSSAVASSSQNSCDWGSDEVSVLDWYAFACDDAASNPACSDADTANSPLTVNAPAVFSISITTDGAIDFSYLDLGTSMVTGPSGIGDTQIVSVDTGPADLDIRSTNFVEGGNTWFLGTGIGSTQVQWEFSKDDSVWTTMAIANNLYTLDTNVSQGQTRPIYFRLTMPTASDSLNQYSSTVTVVASSP